MEPRPHFSYRFGTAEFDESRFELRVAGLPVEVERRALEVLAYLLRHAGEVVTKEELLREVWAGRVTVDKVLPNSINKLRRALGTANAALVTTQNRIGYRLDGPVIRTAVGRQALSTLDLAPGQPVPARPSFELHEQLGLAAGSEVWLARHRKTGERRVYKFALDGDRLRALKREATLLRVLHESLADASHVVEILDWDFETAPYFLECKYGGESLTRWAAQHLAALDTQARIALFLQIADAVADAHSLGVLHKDLKPSNVLVEGSPPAGVHLRLTDFGSGRLLEPDRLAHLGITQMGLTVEDRDGPASTSGTPLYVAPELYEGQAPTVRSDVFALGMLLYQLLAGRIGQPMASGWEADIDDELLREDLRLATHGNPALRLASVAELARRLRELDQRRAAAAQAQRLAAAAERDRAALERARARRPIVVALVAALAVGFGVTAWLQLEATRARDRAQLELGRTQALARFLNEDLIGQSNPLVWAKGRDATLQEVLLAARDRVPKRFAGEPGIAATIHGSLASLFSAVDLFDQAQAEARRALELAPQRGAAGDATAFEAHAMLVRVLAQQGQLDEAARHLAELERLAARGQVPSPQPQVAMARATLKIGRGDFTGAVPEMRAAIDGLGRAGSGNLAQRDMLRVELVRTLVQAQQFDDASAEGRRLIDEVHAREGDNALLVALAQMALVRAQGEDHAAAEQLLKQAQPVIVSRLGENHSRHLALLTELLGVAFRRADWPSAIRYAGQVHERYLAKYGTEHALTWVTLVNWARTLEEAGQPAQALPKAREGHRQLVRVLGAAAPRTQDAAFLLALVELELGNLDRTDALLAQLDSTVLESWRGTGQWAAAIGGLRGVALQRRGQPAAARPLLDAALEALADEAELAQPGRIYLVTKAARARLD